MKKITGFTIVILCGMILAICLAGCLQQRPDPEIGVKNWISAVNNHDYNRLYDLAPREIRQQINLQDFITAQKGNPLFNPGVSIGDYQITNRTLTGDTASLTVVLSLNMLANGNGSPHNTGLFIRFEEVFENGEWKVWTG
jgi:hypothetical protein